MAEQGFTWKFTMAVLAAFGWALVEATLVCLELTLLGLSVLDRLLLSVRAFKVGGGVT